MDVLEGIEPRAHVSGGTCEPRRHGYYPSDLTDAEWRAVRPLIPPRKPVGAERRTRMRAVVDAVFYRARSGCSWRMLPHDFPHWRTVYGYLRQWEQDGTWPRIEQLLRRMRCESRRLEGCAGGARPESPLVRQNHSKQ